METVNVEEARRNFAELLNEVRYQGKEVIVTRHGKPVAKLVPVTQDDLQERDSPPA